MQRLEAFIAPVKQLWQNPGLDEALSSFNGFCELLGIGKVRNYLVSHRVHEVSDWSTMLLDDVGQAMQAELNERVKVMLFAIGIYAALTVHFRPCRFVQQNPFLDALRSESRRILHPTRFRARSGTMLYPLSCQIFSNF